MKIKAKPNGGLTPLDLKGVRPLWGFVVGCLVLTCLSAGCSPKWRQKFIRKNKGTAQTPQPILVLQPDQKSLLPAADRYREHFAFWKSWHSGLLDSFGQVRKRDVAQLNGAVGELQSMISLLAGAPADRLREILMELREYQAQLNRTAPTGQMPAATRTRLEQLFREISKKYHYAHVKDALARE